jgi:SnoaL-like domain
MTDDIDRRLQRLEDEREIARLIASYGPSVDSGNADSAASLWAFDGTYDVEGWRMDSRDDVHAMVTSQSHQDLVANGCCHFLGPCVVTVAGDTAVALCESLVLLRRGDEYVVWRATANHFELSRIEGEWQIVARTSRLLNGNPEARDLLRAGLAGVAATFNP